MDIADARKLAEYLNVSPLVKEKRYNAGNILEDGAISEFGFAKKYWHDDNPSTDKPCIGAFLIRNGEESIWVLLIQWLQTGGYYLVLYPGSPKGRPPICEFPRLDKSNGALSFRWKYRPAKRDGRNPERKAVFQKIYGDEVLIYFPQSEHDVPRFAADLVKLTNARVQADALDDATLPKEDRGAASTGKRYWLYAPGQGAWKWEEFRADGVMSIGWDNLGDLAQYPDREAMRKKIQELYDNGSSPVNASLATWEFVHELREGDVVFAKKGRSEIIGRGIVESKYIYDQERAEYKNIRRVNWTHVGRWEYPGRTAVKTLTDITSHTGRVQTLETLVIGDDLVDVPILEIQRDYPKYTRDDFLEEVFLNEREYDTLVRLLQKKKNLILQGAPGVGKTYIADRLAYSMMGVADEDRVRMVQFHQSYSYEDFMMGFRPTAQGGFELKNGPFYEFCEKARDDKDRDYFFIIDEINRGNLSKIFGELLMLIENERRGEQIRLLYEDELFSVPDNVHLIGLMNTADRSLAMMDYALRRRFAFYEIAPAFDSNGFKTLLKDTAFSKFDALIEIVKKLNVSISEDESLGNGFRIGHSYFSKPPEDMEMGKWLSGLVHYELLPLLNEYWFDEKTKIDEWAAKLQRALND